MRKLFLFLLFITPTLILSQNIQVNGKVVSSLTNEELIGVTVRAIGDEQVGTVTNIDGEFSISVTSGTVLSFSYIGFKSQTRRITDNEFLNILLEEDIQQIEELIIVGTPMRKSDLTGAVATISAETLSEVPTSSVVQALQGKTPGLYVQSSPAPGAKSSIKIRGNNSIHYGTNPIFVIDGLVIEGGFEMINPEDIASISVLKDASATAIYGSRGANGVVVITTKKGTKGKSRITYDTWLGFEEFSKEIPLMNGNQIYDLRIDAYANAYMDRNPNADRQAYIERSLTNPNPIRNLIFSREELESYAEGNSYNWLEEIVQKGFQQNHTVGVSGGHENGSYFLSFNYNDQIGQIKNSSYTRYSGKLNLEQKVKSWLTVGSNNTFVTTNEHPVANGNMFINSLRANPLLPISEEYWYMREGKIDNQSASNPLRDLNVIRDLFTNRFLSSSYINIVPFQDVNFRSTYSLDLQQEEDYTYFPTTSTQSYKSALNGQSVQIKRKYFNWQWDNSLSYNKILQEKHALNVLLGSNMSFYSANHNQQNASGYNNDLFSYKNPQGAPDKDKFYLGAGFSSYSMASYLTRLNYSFDSRYYVTFTYRADGSSKFGSKYKWGSFPSVAVSWNISQESFLKYNNYVNNLRLRLGYGIAGNQNIPNYGYMTLYSPSISLDSGILSNNGVYGNPYLRWEKQKQFNVGLDVGLLKDRINFTFDVFQINNEDLLMQRSTAPSLGYASKLDNIGSLENKGVEFALNVTPIKTNDITWDISFNIASDRNKITQLYDDITEIYNLGGYSNNEIQREGNLFLGQPLNTIYVYKFDKIANEEDMEYVNSLEKSSRIVRPGDLLPLDSDGNEIINDLDRQVVGKKDPDFYGGISTNFSFRNVGININTHYSKGAQRISYLYETLMGGIGNSGAHIDLLNRWSPENTNTRIPRAFSESGRYNIWETDWSVEDASFFRVSEISLYYTLPKKWLDAIKTERIRFYVTGNNLLTLTNYKGYDPDSGDWYPSSRKYVFGMNISF